MEKEMKKMMDLDVFERSKIYQHYCFINTLLKFTIGRGKAVTYPTVSYEQFEHIYTINYGTHEYSASMMYEHYWRFKKDKTFWCAGNHKNMENKLNVTSEFKQYKRSAIAELRTYEEGEVLDTKVSISQADKEAGSPKLGDMIARNPANHDDQWLVAEEYFKNNFEKA